MDMLQGDSKLWKRYYAISQDWVQKWLDWVQAPDKSKAEHPGPVDNTHIMEKMCAMTSDDNQSQKQQFYNVNKHLFYFFCHLYGGGPALVTTGTFKEVELTHYKMNVEPIRQ